MRASQEGSGCGCVNLPRVKTSARIVSVARSTQNKQVPSQRSKDGSDDCTKDEALIDIRDSTKDNDVSRWACFRLDKLDVLLNVCQHWLSCFCNDFSFWCFTNEISATLLIQSLTVSQFNPRLQIHLKVKLRYSKLLNSYFPCSSKLWVLQIYRDCSYTRK